jgi:hypothetical protein
MANETPTGGPVSADALRMQIIEQQMAKMDERAKAIEAEKKKRGDFVEDFMKGEVGDEERAMIRRLVTTAVKKGELEALIYSFPSSLCTDEGRAINNLKPDWPETLQGKARQIFEMYESVAKPAGYKLKAQIINFPGGMPGDVGFFLSWAE